ncbi:MAG: hypothetical protein LBF15_05770 [Candidatus Peribacteria bacterium]|jgi:hypothetical protein|nr:hypothetical protein [Candidatus Peribacteria bacterium]
MLTISSGADVHIATIVSHITKDETFSFFATEEAHSTIKSAHFVSKTNQKIKRIIAKSIIQS